MPNRPAKRAQTYTQDPEQTYAALDLGSNSFHLIVAKDRPQRLQIVDQHRETVRLASGLAQSGYLSENSIEKAYIALQRINQRIRDVPGHNVRIVGTNALRTAKNSHEFAQRAQEILSHEIEVISGREEARLIFLGASHSLEDRSQQRLVVDIGGGSTEFIVGRQFQPRLMESLRMGCISMSDQFFGDGRISSKAMNKAVIAARQEAEVIELLFKAHGWDVAIGTSGTILAIQNALEDGARTPITLDSMDRLTDILVDAKHVDNLPNSLVSQERAPIFPGGVAILKAVFEALEIDVMQVSTGALREGVLHDLLGRVHDEDIREKSIRDVMLRFHIDVAHAERVADTAIHLFNQVKNVWQLDEERDGKLLRWSALVHEIGMDISHSAYHKHGGYLVENLDMQGFSISEQFMLSLLVRSHRRKYPASDLGIPESVSQLIVLLRLAVVLKRNRTDEELPTLTLKTNGKKLTLRIDKDWLKQHPLTSVDLRQEIDQLDQSPYSLSAESM